MSANLLAGVVALLFFMTALLYASVGNAGATGYLAVMALFGFLPEEMKPTALLLNVLVASIAFFKFYRAGYFSWQLFWPFAVASIPSAYFGGSLQLPPALYRPLVSMILFYAAYRLLRLSPKRQAVTGIRPAPVGIALICGAGIGFVAGLSGVGGGIFLSPLLLLVGWSEMRYAAGAAAAFNLVNSLAGLTGYLAIIPALPHALPLWGLAAGAGGWLGAEYGSRKLASHRLQHILAAILIVAGVKILV